MARHNDTGRAGEDAAVEMLTAKGYAIVDRKWRCGRMEIDIVAQRGPRLAIVEVKTRSDAGMDDPIAAVDRRKQLAMVRAATAYIVHTPYCRDCFIEYLLIQFYGFSCISDFWSQSIGYL